MVVTHTTGYHRAVKRNKPLRHAPNWVNFKGTVLSAESHSLTVTCCMILFLWHSWNDKIIQLEARWVGVGAGMGGLRGGARPQRGSRRGLVVRATVYWWGVVRLLPTYMHRWVQVSSEAPGQASSCPMAVSWCGHWTVVMQDASIGESCAKLHTLLYNFEICNYFKIKSFEKFSHRCFNTFS